MYKKPFNLPSAWNKQNMLGYIVRTKLNRSDIYVICDSNIPLSVAFAWTFCPTKTKIVQAISEFGWKMSAAWPLF